MPSSKTGSGAGVAKSIAGPSPTAESDYQAEDDFRTLERAEQVRSDSTRHGRALKHGRKKVAAFARILTRSRRGQPNTRGRRG